MAGSATDPADALLSTTKAARAVSQTTAAPQPLSDDPADALLRTTKTGLPVSQSPQAAPTDNLGDQFAQGFNEGAAGLVGLPGLAGRGINYLMGGGPTPEENQSFWSLHGKAQLPTPADLLATNKLYNPTQPTSLPGELMRGAGAATPTLALGALSGMGPAASAAYTYGPAAAGDLLHHFAGVNPLWATLPTALTMTGGERLLTQWAAKIAATKAAQEAAQEEAAATAARQTHEAGGPGFTRGLQEQQDVAQAQAGRGQAFSEADAAKKHDSEIMAANTHLQTEHARADADREAIASQLGTSKTAEEGAGKMQDKAREWLGGDYKTKMKDAEKGMYYKPDGTPLIAQDAMGDVSNLKGSIEHSYTSEGEAEPIVSLFHSRLPEQVNAKLDAVAKAQGAKRGEAPQFTFDDMRSIRSAIGDALGDPSVISSIGVKKLSEMYRGISDDLRANVSHNAGPEGLTQFDKFNKEATRLFGVAGTVGDNIVTTTNAAKETITPYQLANKNGLWNDATKINQLRSEPVLNEGVNEVAASKLRAGGRDAETAYDKLPEAKTAMYGPHGAMYGPHGTTLDSVVARRAAAEKTSDDMTKVADKDLADMRAAAAKMSSASLKGAEASRQDLRQVRSETGIGLKQEEEARKTALKEAQARLSELNKPPPSGGDFPPWMKNALAMAGPVLAGRHALEPFAAQLPNWGMDATLAGAAGLGYLGRKGMQEIVRNPASIRNLGVAGASVTPFNRGPGGQP